MEILSIWEQSLLTAWGDLSVRLLVFLPVFLGSLLVFVIGVMIAGWLEQLVTHFLKLVKFSDVTKTAGIDGFLKKADVQLDSSALLAVAIRWLIILVFFVAAANILGLTAVTRVLDSLISYIPKVVSAALIIAAGVFVANLVEGLVKGALATVDHGHAKPLAHLARWVVLVVATLAAVNELQIAQTLITTFFQGLTWTVTLAVGLAVGLGSKELVSQLLRDWYDKLKK